MSNHTRGPWIPSDINDGLLPRNEADVILMAAEPDLLASLKSILVVYDSLKADEQEWGHYERDVADAREAIAKAEGTQ